MKRLASTGLCAAIIAPLAFHPTSASAKNDRDWIEAVALEKDGITTQRVEVRSTDEQYEDDYEGDYRFALTGYAKAKKNRRIARVVWQSKKNSFFAGGANKPTWERLGLIKHGLREQKVDGSQMIPLSRLTWVESPAQACANLKGQKLKSGMSADDFMVESWKTTAKAALHLKVYATRKSAKHLTDTNHDTETAMMSYPVNVTCLAQAKPSRARAEAVTKPNRKPPARAPRAPIE